jgi:uncharacterized membrane protein
MVYLKNQNPEWIERIIAAFCYLSCGLVGLIYILCSGKHARAPFFYFHFLQSIILGIFTWLLNWTENIIREMLSGILGLILGSFAPAAGFLTAVNFGFDWFLLLVGKAAYLLVIYGFIFALLGRYAEIPFLSKLVHNQMH